jgi:hypothetical protein
MFTNPKHAQAVLTKLQTELKRTGVNPHIDTKNVWIFTGPYSNAPSEKSENFYGVITHNGRKFFVGYHVDEQLPFVIKEFPANEGPIAYFRDEDPSREKRFGTPKAVARAVRDW